MRFPLHEFHLSVVSLTNLTLPYLTGLLNELGSNPVPLVSLSLPLKPIAAESEEDIAAFLASLCSLRRLRSLDIGGQASQLSPDQVYSLSLKLGLLVQFCGVNLTYVLPCLLANHQ